MSSMDEAREALERSLVREADARLRAEAAEARLRLVASLLSGWRMRPETDIDYALDMARDDARGHESEGTR